MRENYIDISKKIMIELLKKLNKDAIIVIRNKERENQCGAKICYKKL